MTTVLLITGSTSGVGRYVAERLAGTGTDVLAHGRDEAKLTELTDRIGARPHLADLASLREVRDLAARIRAGHDHLDVLVNNAGAGRRAVRRRAAAGYPRRCERPDRVVGPAERISRGVGQA